MPDFTKMPAPPIKSMEGEKNADTIDSVWNRFHATIKNVSERGLQTSSVYDETAFCQGNKTEIERTLRLADF